jgi:plastocyanin
MAKILVSDAVRIIPRDTDFLNRRSGNFGEIFYDRTANSLRLYNGVTTGGVNLAKADLTNISNSDFLSKATAAGVGSGGGSSIVSVSAEDSTINQATNGVIKFNGLNGIAVTTSAGGIVNITSPTIPVASTDIAGVVRIDGTTISIEDGVISSVPPTVLSNIEGMNFRRGVAVFEFSTDTGFTDNATDAVPTENAVRAYIDRRLGYNHDGSTVLDGNLIPGGEGSRYATESFVTNLIGDFNELSDIISAELTIDKIYLPAITMLRVSNNGASAYRFDQYGTTDNPTIFAINGTTIAFNLTASGHPFQIQNGAGVNYNTGLVHVSTVGVVTTGSAAQGKDSGTLYWKVPSDISGGYRYQCSAHVPMVGSITVKAFSTL